MNGPEITHEMVSEYFGNVLYVQRQKGIENHGTEPWRAGDGRDTLADLTEEIVDAFQYATKLRLEMQALNRDAELARNLRKWWRKGERSEEFFGAYCVAAMLDMDREEDGDGER